MAAALGTSAVDLFRQIVRLLAWLDRIENELLDVYSQRLIAAANFEPAHMVALNQRDERLQMELKQLRPKRAEILKCGQRLGLKCPDLKTLLRALSAYISVEGGIDAEQHALTTAWLRRVETIGRDLQRQIWTNWHVIHRGNRELIELRNLFAGQSSSLGSGLPARARSPGGVLLDAKV